MRRRDRSGRDSLRERLCPGAAAKLVSATAIPVSQRRAKQRVQPQAHFYGFRDLLVTAWPLEVSSRGRGLPTWHRIRLPQNLLWPSTDLMFWASKRANGITLTGRDIALLIIALHRPACAPLCLHINFDTDIAPFPHFSLDDFSDTVFFPLPIVY